MKSRILKILGRYSCQQRHQDVLEGETSKSVNVKEPRLTTQASIQFNSNVPQAPYPSWMAALEIRKPLGSSLNLWEPSNRNAK